MNRNLLLSRRASWRRTAARLLRASGRVAAALLLLGVLPWVTPPAVAGERGGDGGNWHRGWGSGGWHGGNWHGGNWHGGGWYGGRWYGGRWYPGGWYGPWCCASSGWWGPNVSFNFGTWGFYGYPYPVYAAPAYVAPVYVAPPPVTVIQQPAAPPPPVRQQFWYYCDNPRGYYPYVAACSAGWRQVPVTPPGTTP
jgi:hypothetical protein